MRKRPLIESFNYAIEGLVHVLKTQRNMRIHFLAAFFVLVLSLFFELTRFELIAIFFAIILVLVSELINTALEASIDIYTSTYDPLAKMAKDVAASAVLLSAINAIFVGYFVFFPRLNKFSLVALQRIKSLPLYVTGVALALVLISSLALKAWTGAKNFMRGGWPSAHSAAAGSLFTSISLLSKNFLVATLAFSLCLLVIQSRVEKEIHSWFEVIAGSIIGILLTVLIFQIFGLI
jgi:diacylglycerol kinase (ATP)